MKRSSVCFALLSGIAMAGFGCSSSSSGPNDGGSGGKDAAAGSGGHAGGGAGGTAVAGSGGSAAGTGGGGGTGTAGQDGGSSDAMSDGDAGSVDGDAGSNPVAARGEYLVKSVLGCSGCHTPTVNGAPDMTKFLSGVDCFVKSTTTNDCLSSANLTNDDTGLKGFTDQAIKDAIRKGKDPDPQANGAYLFARMPYYQFATLSDDDASAIVAYLRTVPAVNHEPQAAAGIYATAPTSPENAGISLTDMPAGASSTSATNGKYLASLACATCHTVDAMNATPKKIDTTKLLQGGRIVTVTSNNTSTMVQSWNLTPDATGLMGWTAADIAKAVKMGMDKSGKTICGMRALTSIMDSDATDIGTYLASIPAAANALTMMCP